MNIDIVKPMEASIPKPSSVRGVMALGSVAQRIFTIKKIALTMPIGFPKNKPSVTPSATWVEKMSERLKLVKLIPALAIANIGIIKKVTIGANLCSSCCSKGIAILVSC